MLTRRSQARFEVKDKRRLSFYAAIFNAPALITERDASGNLVKYNEVILPSAFDDTLATDTEVIANLDHDEVDTFAKRSNGSLVLQVDPFGLYCSCYLHDDAIRQRINSGELDGCSFRFVPVVDRTSNGVVERVSVKLYDVCLTSNPAYVQTKGEVHLRVQDKTSYLLARYKYALLKNASRPLHKRS